MLRAAVGKYLLRCCSGILLWLACMPGAAAQAEDTGFSVREIWFDKYDNGYAVRADFQVGHLATIEKIVQGGYALQFNFELLFMQRRDWLLDQMVGDIGWHGTLSYDPLTRSYQLASSGGKTQRFSRLEEAAREISQLRAGANNDEGYVKILLRKDVYLRARFYPVTAELPSTLQIGLLVDEHWDAAEDWTEFILDIRDP